jgi:hypothetical protein
LFRNQTVSLRIEKNGGRLFRRPKLTLSCSTEGKGEGRNEGRKKGRKERRKERRKEGRKEGRKEEGRKEGRKEGYPEYAGRIFLRNIDTHLPEYAVP